MSASPPDRFDVSRFFLYGSLVFSLYLAYRLLSPFLHTLILSILLASLFHPLHEAVCRAFRYRYPSLASLCACLIIVLGVVIPLALLSIAITEQGIHLFNTIADWLHSGGMERIADSSILERVRTLANRYLPYVHADAFNFQESLLSFSRAMAQVFFRNLSSIIGNLTSLVFRFFLMLFILFYLFKEGSNLLNRALRTVPMAPEKKEKVIQQIRVISRTTVMGIFLTAMIQGLIGGIGVLFVQLPSVFWGAMIAFASLIPMVGTALIYVPLSLFVLYKGEYGLCILFFLWNAVLSNVVDNVVRPKLLGRQGGVPPLLIFLSILGGLQVFGFIGIFYGPLIFGICGIFLYLYELENADVLLSRSDSPSS